MTTHVVPLPPPLAPLSMLSAGLPRRILELSTITSSDTYSRHHIWREGGREGVKSHYPNETSGLATVYHRYYLSTIRRVDPEEGPFNMET